MKRSAEKAALGGSAPGGTDVPAPTASAAPVTVALGPLEAFDIATHEALLQLKLALTRFGQQYNKLAFQYERQQGTVHLLQKRNAVLESLITKHGIVQTVADDDDDDADTDDGDSSTLRHDDSAEQPPSPDTTTPSDTQPMQGGTPRPHARSTTEAHTATSIHSTHTHS